MKKIISLVLILLLSVSLGACGNKEVSKNNTHEKNKENAVINSDKTDNNKDSNQSSNNNSAVNVSKENANINNVDKSEKDDNNPDSVYENELNLDDPSMLKKYVINILISNEIDTSFNNITVEVVKTEVNAYLGKDYFEYNLGAKPPQSLEHCYLLLADEADYLISVEDTSEIYKCVYGDFSDRKFYRYISGQWKPAAFGEGVMDADNIKNKDEQAKKDVVVSNESINEVSNKVLRALKEKDMSTLSEYVHPSKGIRFSTYGYVEDDDIVFSKDKIREFFKDSNIYHWGEYDGIGDPIKLTPAEYYDKFIYDFDFLNKATQIGVNETIGTGCTIANHQEYYENSQFVEYHFKGTEEYGGMDWLSLRIICEKVDDRWYVVGISHAQWTI